MCCAEFISPTSKEEPHGNSLVNFLTTPLINPIYSQNIKTQSPQKMKCLTPTMVADASKTLPVATPQKPAKRKPGRKPKPVAPKKPITREDKEVIVSFD